MGTPEDQRANSGFLDGGDSTLDLNVAVQLPGALSGLVWLDGNGDGIQNPSESILSNTLVILYDGTGEVAGEAETDADGGYHFDGLVPGEYWVEYINTDAYSISPQHRGDDPTRDSEPDVDSSQTDRIDVGSGVHVPHINAGFYQGTSITSHFWLDSDNDGLQDEGEEGLSNFTVYLYNTNDEVVAETMTDQDGYYGFSDLVPGDYYIAIEQTSDKVATTLVQHDESCFLQSEVFTTEVNESLSIPDIGFVERVSISSYVWLDTDKDGLVGENETGMTDIEVRLFDDEGNSIEEARTDEEGRVDFLVVPGIYQIEVNLPDGVEFTLPNFTDDSFSSDVDPETGRTELIVLTSGETDKSYLVGVVVNPTAIQLMSLVATETSSGVQVEWITGSEIDTFGFQILRSRDGSIESAVTVTEDMVLSRGSDGAYEFIDTTARAGQAYSYWLAEVQNDQTVYHYGPTQVVVEGLRRATDGFMLFLPLIQK